jgi:predicted ribosome quality control (RQC) complex YloA/Tae2 family protein
VITSWFTWEKLCKVMNARLKGQIFSECYSHVKSELVIQNENVRGESIRIHLEQPLPFIFLQHIHPPAQRVRIFPDFDHLEFTEAHMAAADRDMRLNFSKGVSLMIRIRPPKSNVFMLTNTSVESFKKRKVESLDFKSGPLVFDTLSEDPRLNAFWKKRLTDLYPDVSWPDLQAEISRANGKILGGRFVLLPEPGETFNPHRFYDNYRAFITDRLKELHFKPEKERIIKALSSRAEKLSRRIHHLSRPDEKNNQIDTYRMYGDILMAILHTIQPGQEEVKIPEDLRPRGFPETIPLKPDLSPPANARRYYNRAGKIERSRREAEETKETLQKEQDKLKLKATELENIETLKDLKSWVKKNKDLVADLTRTENPQKSESARLPYREFFYKSWRIWVGKSAKDNDDMTFHHAHKTDLWLHTRHSTGSHVIIRREGKSHIPGDIIEFAASLAARFSEEKHASLVPVVCAERKHVTKRKGFPPGKVTFTMEKSLLIKPADIE